MYLVSRKRISASYIYIFFVSKEEGYSLNGEFRRHLSDTPFPINSLHRNVLDNARLWRTHEVPRQKRRKTHRLADPDTHFDHLESFGLPRTWKSPTFAANGRTLFRGHSVQTVKKRHWQNGLSNFVTLVRGSSNDYLTPLSMRGGAGSVSDLQTCQYTSYAWRLLSPQSSSTFDEVEWACLCLIH